MQRRDLSVKTQMGRIFEKLESFLYFSFLPIQKAPTGSCAQRELSGHVGFFGDAGAKTAGANRLPRFL